MVQKTEKVTERIIKVLKAEYVNIFGAELDQIIFQKTSWQKQHLVHL